MEAHSLKQPKSIALGVRANNTPGGDHVVESKLFEENANAANSSTTPSLQKQFFSPVLNDMKWAVPSQPG
ncbi:hypothetical protein KIN20_014718 [Parelaphostrongylus tenuis]|uniref:Uncharacterized protein n=1 Tax=Parelaphostrongylus tenuis TaxID=148309 RepID=A0AAD5MXN0_PARTN|nr:hypothetical protein KIN20_014718 [Parelaphostrongylus tenuis]